MIRYYLSGGSVNSDPAASLGGEASTTELGGDAVTWAGSALSGVTLLGGSGHIADDGGDSATAARLELTAYGSLRWLRLIPYGVPAATADAQQGNQIEISAGGEFTLSYRFSTGRSCSVSVEVSAGSLPGADTTGLLAVAEGGRALFGDLTAQQAITGTTHYRCIYLANEGATDLPDLGLWIAQQPGSAALALAAGLTGTPETLAAETDTPAGVSFSAAGSLDDALPLGLPAGTSTPVWLRRISPPGNLSAARDDSAELIVEVR